MWILDKLLRQTIRIGLLTVIDHRGRAYRYGSATPGGRQVTVRMTDAGAASHIARYPRVGAGEAYMAGRMVVEEGDIRELALLVSENAPSEDGGPLAASGFVRRGVDRILARLDQVNWRSRSRRNAEHTYNLTRELYELFLDEDRQYTCGYHRDPDDTLEQAQVDKKAHLAAKLRIRPGQRVLDIGCGWGGLALYLHRHYDVDMLGIALAPDQIAFCRERAEAAGVVDRVRFELIDYRDVEGPFDRIVSVGLIEHLGTPHYPGFFAGMGKLLAPDGVMVSHCCGRMGATRRHRPVDTAVHLPGRLHPRAVRTRDAGRAARLHRQRGGGAALPLRAYAGRMVQADVRSEGRDRRALRRTLLPNVAILSRRCRGRLPLWRVGQLAAAIYEAARRPSDHARLSVGRGTAIEPAGSCRGGHRRNSPFLR